MASTVPAKSQPLHNFALPHLKWKNNHSRARSSPSSGNKSDKLSSSSAAADPAASPHRQSPLRRSQSPMRQSPLRDLPLQSPLRELPRRHSPMREPFRSSPMREARRQSPLYAGGEAVTEPEASLKNKTIIEYKRHPRNLSKNGVSAPDHDIISEKSEKKSKPLDSHHMPNCNTNVNNNNNMNNKESRSKFLIKIQAAPKKVSNNKGQGGEGNQATLNELKDEEVQGEDHEPVAKTWNLRPRKPLRKLSNVNGGGGVALRGSGSIVLENKAQSGAEQVSLDKGDKVKVEGEANGSEKKEKRIRFSIPLSRVEIEEDICAITGSKPTRRPKKRAKCVQKQIDNLFPGLWLASITPDSYKVSENAMKG